MEQSYLPVHIGIIPDGNRRWAKERGLPTLEGHRRGYKAAIEISRKAREMGIKVLTIWGFSTENWKRTQEEVGYLMKLYEGWIDEYLKDALKNEVRIVHIGRKDRFNNVLLGKIQKAEEKTKHFTKNTLVIALDYGGRDEVIRAIKKMQMKNFDIEKLDQDNFKQFLDTDGIPEPDLIIRTSGEQRSSGFLLYEADYAEFMFVDKYFPDFSPEDLEKCVQEYQSRQRRFGK